MEVSRAIGHGVDCGKLENFFPGHSMKRHCSFTPLSVSILWPCFMVAFTIFCNYLSVYLMIACLPSMSQHPEECLAQNSHPVHIGWVSEWADKHATCMARCSYILIEFEIWIFTWNHLIFRCWWLMWKAKNTMLAGNKLACGALLLAIICLLAAQFLCRMK